MKNPTQPVIFKFNVEKFKEFAQEQIALCNYAIETEQDEDKRSETIELRDGWIDMLKD